MKLTEPKSTLVAGGGVKFFIDSGSVHKGQSRVIGKVDFTV